MTTFNQQHLLHVLYDLALTLSGETESRALAERFLQRLLYHTGFACALLAERLDGGTGADRGSLRVLQTMGNSDLARKIGTDVNWPGWLSAAHSESLCPVRLPRHLFARAAGYTAVLRLCPDDERLLLLFGATARVGEIDLARVFLPVVSRFALAYRLCENNERNQRLLRRESEARIRKEMALYRIEQQLSDLLEASPLPMITIAMHDGQHLAFNAKATALFGWAAVDVPNYAAWCHRAFPDPVSRQQMQDLWEVEVPRATATQSGFGPIEVEVACKDGQVRLVEFHGKAVGEKMVLQAVDQTGRQQLQVSLRAAMSAAEEADRAKTRFLASISHQLNMPLNAILGHAELIDAAAEGVAELRQSARQILTSGRNLLDVVTAALTLSRLDAAGERVPAEPVGVAAVVAASVGACEPQAAAAQVAIVCEGGLEASVLGNADALRQILVVLLDNAIKYNRSHGTVWVSGSTLGGDRLRVTVRDNGVGIDPRRAGELFQPFSRLDAETGPVAGSGIGLYLARQLVTRMAGEIGYRSTVGFGSSFWIDLPLAVATATTSAEEAAGGGARAFHVLVAEDHPLNQSLISLQLGKLGCEVTIADNGVEALDRLRAGGIDLVLTDCNMPAMDGYALAEAIRRAESAAGGGRRLPIIACTAVDTDEEKARCLASGMDDFLSKPVRLDGLRQVVSRWLALGADASGDRSGSAVASPRRQAAASDGSPACIERLDGLLGGTPGDEARKLVALFIQTAEESLHEGREAFHEHAAGRFFQAMHKLKSSARLVAADELAERCQLLESAGRAEDWAAVGERLPGLERELTEVLRQLTVLPRQHGDAGRGTTVLPGYPELRDRRVLVVDDDAFIREYISELLHQQAVAAVYQATDGESALSALDRLGDDVDTLLCDLNMPGMDGIELIRHVGKRGFDGCLFLISGEDSRVLKTAYHLAEAHGLHVGGTLSKPFTPANLFELLRQHGPRSNAATGPDGLPEIRPLEILEGLRRNQFSVHFQPKVDARTLELIGAEVLVRWRRASGMVPPAAFIPVAETYGLIDEIFLFVLGEAMLLGGQLNRDGRHVKFAVNMSALSLGSLAIPEVVLAKATERGFDPGDLILEITESGVMRDMRTALDVLTRLRLRRVGLSIDDFGTGYSSLEQLRRIPFGELKVDRAFVNGAVDDPTARSILETSVDVGRKLGLTIVAEGVETEADLALVRSVGCDVIQGYHIAEPMPWSDFLAWVESRQARRHCWSA